MRCPDCHGTGKLTCRLNGAPYVYPLLPCHRCGGCGRDHCCSGEREQPEAPEQPEPDKREVEDG